MTELGFLRTVFSDSTEASAFLTDDGKLICTQSRSGYSFLSAVHAARFVLQYFPLQDQDWFVLNDPQSGGITPFGVNIVGRLGNLIWSVRLEGEAKWSLDEKWEPMGFKLPPLPLHLGGKTNEQIPGVFLDKVRPFEDRIRPQYEKLKTFVAWKKSQLTPTAFNAYFKNCESVMREKLKETPWTEYQHKARAQSGEILRTKISITENWVLVDFAGTNLLTHLELDERLTESIVTYALAQALQTYDIFNHGTESYLQIIKPKQSWLNIRNPKYPARVRFLAIPFLETYLKQMLSKMKFKMDDWKCSLEGWMQLVSDSGETVNTDQLRENWGVGVSFLKTIGTGDSALQYELLTSAELLRIESGQIEALSLQKGAQLEIQII